VGEDAAETKSLIDAACAGDRAAMDALVVRFGPLVRNALRGKIAEDLRKRLDTDDLFQSTMTAALADLPGFQYRDEPSFRAWLVLVAERQAAMAGRRNRRKMRALAREEAPEAGAEAPALRTTPSALASRRESSVQLSDAVAALPPEDRRVVELHSYQGLSFAETARIAGLADEDAARWVFRRALKRLGETMGGGG
jgi:RNA polymerase sigma factor (sigma-70 family)